MAGMKASVAWLREKVGHSLREGRPFAAMRSAIRCEVHVAMSGANCARPVCCKCVLAFVLFFIIYLEARVNSFGGLEPSVHLRPDRGHPLRVGVGASSDEQRLDSLDVQRERNFGLALRAKSGITKGLNRSVFHDGPFQTAQGTREGCLGLWIGPIPTSPSPQHR